MPRTVADLPRYDKLRASRKALGRAAYWVRFGIFSIGCSLFLDQVKSLVSDMELTWGEQRIIAIIGVSYLGGFGLASWIAGRLITTSADLIDVVIDQAEAANRTANLIEQHALPVLGRMALALEKLASEAKVGDSADEETLRRFEVARQAITGSRWAQAEKLVGAFVRDHPGPDAARLLAELEDGRNRVVDGLTKRLEAAQLRGDALLVVEVRDALTEHLRGDRLADFDRKVVRWLVGEIKSQVRAGTIKPELATLATRVADSFADTPEGAALKTSIPNIRRSAGLCPRCARAYRGSADACPRCLASGANPSFAPLSDDAE